ncbi:hypothetical protein BRM3_02245 [Brachybacterium huguangmaarense]|uniref:Uncharacterized protein n=1 Tax=Brachybacterium huguangmaarense TaxID=1652028 RepID=A0ABY6G388_9MICO|nr:hypothetical protein [Brachybacterium huguangmaarense]UYG17276.1 hypothetical protein BRM3_02245 [Brachybacterium huguangmaarense]
MSAPAAVKPMAHQKECWNAPVSAACAPAAPAPDATPAPAAVAAPVRITASTAVPNDPPTCWAIRVMMLASGRVVLDLEVDLSAQSGHALGEEMRRLPEFIELREQVAGAIEH